MKELTGISASPGIAIGKVFLYLDDTYKVPRYDIKDRDITREIERFHEASDKASEEIRNLREQSKSEMGEEESRFLDSHILMLNDPDFIETIESGLKKDKKNVEWILLETSNKLIDKLKASTDSYLRERTIDIHDISKRIVNHLLFRDKISLADLHEKVIVVTNNLLPSDAITMNKLNVLGIAMNVGGKTSHTAILARSFEIPAVLGLSEITRYAKTGDELIIDGNAGKVILNPDKKTKTHYQNIMHEWQKREARLLTFNELFPETKDGKLIKLYANIEVPEEVESVISHGADGIGLYRSEFLFLNSNGFSTEDEQYTAYKTVLEAMKGKPVTIRTLDVGGDKVFSDFSTEKERNPILGWRAIRFCLSKVDIFKQQLRALLRASVHGKLRIMYPMISGIEELNRVFKIYEEVKEELSEKGIAFSDNIPVGIMIEIPSAALTSDILAKKVDFFSIGTNDLIQYTIAVDRGNEKIAYLYEPFHPGVLRLIKMIIQNAHLQGIPISMCGEMAGDPMASVILLGLGLDGFSMSSFGIPEVKQIIRSVRMDEAEELVGTIMEMKSYCEIDSYVKEWMNERFDIFSG